MSLPTDGRREHCVEPPTVMALGGAQSSGKEQQRHIR
jgi:hypothetical protein